MMVYILTPIVSPRLTKFYYIQQYLTKNEILYEGSPHAKMERLLWRQDYWYLFPVY